MKISVDEIDQLQDKIDEKTNSYLEQNGWKNSCGNPMHIWLWEKEIDGKQFTLPRSLAREMQERLDISLELEDEEEL
jgi:hypothetical protein